MKKKMPVFFSAHITRDQSKDSGMAFVFILLLIGLFTGNRDWFPVAAVALFIDMLFPLFFYPFAIAWLGLSKILGAIMSKLLLLTIYMVVVVPVALARRLPGKDPLKLRAFKKSRMSVLKSRDHLFEAADLEKPF